MKNVRKNSDIKNIPKSRSIDTTFLLVIWVSNFRIPLCK